MKTLGLVDAAEFLRMHPEEVRRRARMGQLPGAKAGKRWVFIEDDLAAYLRSLYAPVQQALRVTLRKEAECHFANAAGRGGSISSRQPASELDALLELKTRPRRRNSTTS